LRTLRAVVVLAVALPLSGCWLQIGFGPGHTWSNALEDQLTTANVATLEQQWSVSLAPALSEPVVAGDRAYVVVQGFSASGEFVEVDAIDTASGAIAWERTLDSLVVANGRIAGMPPALVGSELWTGSYVEQTSPQVDCRAHRVRLDGRTGAVVAEEDGFGSSAVSSGSTIVEKQAAEFFTPSCPDSPPSLVVRDSQSLATNWTASLPALGTVVPELGPAVTGGRIFALHGSTLSAFAAAGCGAATCAPVWTANAPAGMRPAGPPVAAPGGRVFVIYVDQFAVPSSAELVGYSASTGAVAWQAQVGDDVVPDLGVKMAVDGSRLYVTSTPTPHGLQVFATSGCGAATCAPIWSVATPNSGFGSQPAGPVVAGGVVYVADASGLRAYPAAGCGAATCDQIAGLPVDGVPTGVSITNGRLYLTTDTGDLTAYAPT
jgi:hypothetical protein